MPASTPAGMILISLACHLITIAPATLGNHRNLPPILRRYGVNTHHGVANVSVSLNTGSPKPTGTPSPPHNRAPTEAVQRDFFR